MCVELSASSFGSSETTLVLVCPSCGREYRASEKRLRSGDGYVCKGCQSAVITTALGGQWYAALCVTQKDYDDLKDVQLRDLRDRWAATFDRHHGNPSREEAEELLRLARSRDPGNQAGYDLGDLLGCLGYVF